MADLITSTRAKYNIAQSSFSADEDSLIAALITACSKAIQRWCKRDFASASFDELYNGTDTDRLLLRQFPIVSVSRVAYAPTAVLKVRNSSASNQRATVQVTSTGLSLVRVASAASSTDTVTFAGNTTLSALATAINALGNGWSASVLDSRFNNRASADLKALQGAFNAKDVDAQLKLHTEELSDYEIDANRGWLLRNGWSCADAVVWYGGVNYWRVLYTAGYSTVPEDVQEACAQWVAAHFWAAKRDPGVLQESIANAVARTNDKEMPANVKLLIDAYRNHRLVQLGG